MFEEGIYFKCLGKKVEICLQVEACAPAEGTAYIPLKLLFSSLSIYQSVFYAHLRTSELDSTEGDVDG